MKVADSICTMASAIDVGVELSIDFNIPHYAILVVARLCGASKSSKES